MDGTKTLFKHLERRHLEPSKTWRNLLRDWSRFETIAVSMIALSFSFASLPSATLLADTPRTLELKALQLGGIPRPIDSIDASIPRPARLIKPKARLVAADQSPIVAVRTPESNPTSNPSLSSADAYSVNVGQDRSLQDDTDQVSSSESESAHTAGSNTAGLNTAGSKSVEEALDTRGSVTFRKTPLSEVVFLLSDLWHINIVAGENVNGEVSGSFHDAPLREVLSAVLSSSGYSYRKTGSSLVVLTADQVGSDDPTFVSATIVLPERLRDDETSLDTAGMLLSERGQMKRLGADLILVIDSADRIERVRDLFAGFGPSSSTYDGGDGDGQVLTSIPAMSASGIAYFTPQYTEAEEMATPLQSALGDQVIVAVFPTENRIMVKGSKNDLKLAAEAIEQLDRPRSQVRITATIYDVSLKEVERLGINWNVQPHSSGLSLTDLNDAESLRFRNLVTASTGLISDTAASGAGNFSISTINDVLNVDALLQALHGNSEAKLLADPSVTVGDRREASIRIVQKIPIIAADPVDNSGVVFSQVQFEEAGVILNVQPRISRDGTIDLKVQPEYSVVADFIQNNPVIDSRTAQTTVRVGNGQTFVLGGLRQKSIVESTRGVPFLKDMKYVGKLFRSHDTEIRESELIVFIKPEIITPYDCGNVRQQEAACVTNRQLDKIPHAQDQSMIPCCQDPHCPNHHPHCKANAGTDGLRFSDWDQDYEQVPSHGYPVITDGPVEEQFVPETRDVPAHQPPVESYYPEVHVDERMLQPVIVQ